jgi:hypothetical protein
VFAYSNYPVVTISCLIKADGEAVVVFLHSNGLLVTAAYEGVLKSEISKMFKIQTEDICKSMECRLDDHGSLEIWTRHCRSISHAKVDMCIVSNRKSTSSFWSYAKSFVATTVAESTPEKVSMGLLESVDDLLVPVSYEPIVIVPDEAILFEVDPSFISINCESIAILYYPGNVEVRKLSNLKRVEYRMDGLTDLSSIVWLDKTHIALGRLHAIEKWNGNILVENELVASKSKILPIVNGGRPSIPSALLVQPLSAGFVKYDFSKLLRPQVQASQITAATISMILSQFTRVNEKQILHGADHSEIVTSLEVVCVFLDECADQGEQVRRELELLRLYKDIVSEWGKGSIPLTSHPCASEPLDLIYQEWQTSCIEFDFSEFFEWFKETGLVGSIVLPDIKSPIHQGKTSLKLGSYREFSLDEIRGVEMILSSLLQFPDDPFLPKLVTTQLNIYTKKIEGVVQNWFANLDVMPSVLMSNRALVKFLKLTFPGGRLVEVNDCRYMAVLVLLSIVDDGSKFLELIPVLKRFKYCSPSLIAGTDWRYLAATIPRGSERDAFMKSLFEVHACTGDLICVDVDTLIIEKLHVLILLSVPIFDGGYISVLETYFALPIDSDKVVIGGLIFVRIFFGQVMEWLDMVEVRGVGEVDWSVWDNAVKLCSTIVDVGDSYSPGMLGVAPPTKRFDMMRKFLYVISLCLKVKRIGPISRLVTGLTLFPQAEVAFDTSAAISLLVSIGLGSREGSRFVHDTAKKLGLYSATCSGIVSQLLDSCFDRDIEEFVKGADDLTVIFNRVIRERLGVAVKILSEDTSRLHGLVYTIISPEIATELMNVESKSERIIREWILVDGPRDVLQSCCRLAVHPKVKSSSTPGVLDTYYTISRKLIKAIDEV